MMPSGWTRKRGSTWTWYIEDVPDPSNGRPRQVSKGGFRTRKEARDGLLEAQAALRSGTFVEPSKRTVRSLPAGGVAPGEPAAAAAALLVRQLHQLHQDPCRAPAGGHRAAAAHPLQPQRLLPRPPRPTPGGTARAWPPRRCATSTPCCTGPSRTPSASATWSATWPMPSPRRGAPRRRCRSGPPSSCAPSWPTSARIACTPSGCWSPPPGCGGPSSPGLRWVDVDLGAARLSPRRPRVVVNYVVHESEPKTRMGKRSLALDPATLAALREHKARQEQERADVGSAWTRLGPGVHPAGRLPHPPRPDHRLVPSGWPAPPACRRSGSTTSATATPPRRWPPASRPRWSASASATPPSPSPSTSTATSSPAWTPRPPTPWPV